MGTIGGSVAHADPSADYPAALQALEAKIVLKGAKSERTVAAEDFFVDTFTTALEPGEIVREVIVPVEDAGTGTNYQKVLQPASGFAIVGIAVQDQERVTMARIGVTGLSNRAYPRAVGGESARRQGGTCRDSGGGVGRGRRRRQLRSARIGRLSDAPGGGVHCACDSRCHVEDGLKISGNYTLAARRTSVPMMQDPTSWRAPCRAAKASKKSATTSTA